MARMFLLSTDISPNPFTTPFVGKRCVMPHPASRKELIYSKTVFMSEDFG
jgi:hypothetical protein